MLQSLLRCIDSPGLHSPRELAKQLEVHEALMQSMIDALAEMGYLESPQSDCHQCDSCSSAANCCVSSFGRRWMLTEAGKRVIRNHPD